MLSTARPIAPLIIVFLLISMVIGIGWDFSLAHHLDNFVLLGANIVFFLIFLLAFFIQKKALENANPNVFIRSVMGGMMIKMFICIIAVMSYVLAAGTSVNKISIFIAMFFYLIYLAVEVMILMKMNKQKNG
ncbi:MAG: hypothetical protein ABI091_27225 [Ferruginibacter sp.]